MGVFWLGSKLPWGLARGARGLHWGGGGVGGGGLAFLHFLEVRLRGFGRAEHEVALHLIKHGVVWVSHPNNSALAGVDAGDGAHFTSPLHGTWVGVPTRGSLPPPPPSSPPPASFPPPSSFFPPPPVLLRGGDGLCLLGWVTSLGGGSPRRRRTKRKRRGVWTRCPSLTRTASSSSRWFKWWFATLPFFFLNHTANVQWSVSEIRKGKPIIQI